MSVLVYTENWDGLFRKSTFESVCYAYDIAKLLNTDVVAVSLGIVDDRELNKLGSYGANKIISLPNINKSDSQIAATAIKNLTTDSNIIVFSNTYSAKMIAPQLSVKIKAGLITNVIGLPEDISPFTIKRTAFSSKAIEKVKLNTTKGILSLNPNSYTATKKEKANIPIETLDTSIESNITIESQESIKNKISLSEAEIIVAGGRGLKGPENWSMIEELATLLGAATACSKPVSDSGWRPHSEHVGQTGKAVAPNLYIAIGISGAIQHLAGVNSSKIMVVINTDAEAPFFKAADYGIIGDAFDIVPKMIEIIKSTNI